MTSFEVYPNPISPDCTDCNPNYGSSRGQKGITIWGPITFTLQAGQTSEPLYFTFTNPKCYNGLHFCNVTYTIRTDRYVYGGDDAGPIEMWINNPDNNNQFLDLNWRENQHYHSKVCFDGTEYHDLTETVDISQGHVGTLLNRSGVNNIRFRNLDQHNVAVTIIDFKIVAGYGMAGITIYGDNCDTNGSYPSEHPDFATRQDYPCTYHQDNDPGTVYGGMGFTGFSTDNHVNDWIVPNQTVQWTWTNPMNPSHSYKGKVSCLFNLNNVHLNQSSSNDDIKFSLKVNNSSWVNFYHTKNVEHPMYHSIDLATHPILSTSGGYDDTPGATNTLQLHLDNNAGASFALCDGCDDPNYPCPSQCIGGRVNLYRVYRTEPLNGQNTITTYQTTGGQITPNNPQVWAYQSQTFNITPNADYVISSVYIDGENKGVISSYTFDSITQGHTITANFIHQFDVTLQPNPEGIIAGPATVDQGSNPQYTVTAYCGSIAHVYLDYGTGNQQDLGAHASPYTFNPFPNISGDHTITAEFSTTPGLFAISFDVDHQGIMYTPEPCTFVVDGVSYAPDAGGNYATACLAAGKHSFTATPAVIHVENDYGYHPIIDLEYGTSTYTCNPATINITASGVVRAIYDTVEDEPSQCTVTVSAGEHGTIYPNPESHSIQALTGGCAKFRIIPDSGYQVASASFGGQTVVILDNEFTANNISGNPTFAVTFSRIPTRIQGNKRATVQNATSLSLTLDSTPTNGNLLVAAIGSYASYPPNVTSITQTSVTWTKQIQSSNSSLYGRNVEIWAGTISSAASQNLTINFSGNGDLFADICEYSGLLSSGFLDKTATSSGTYTTNLTTGTTATTSQASELLIGAIFNVCNSGGGQNSTSPTNGFSLLDGIGTVNSQTKSLSYLEKIATATTNGSSQVTGGTYATYEAYVGCIATFKFANGSQQFSIETSPGSGGAINPSGTVYVTPDGSQGFNITANAGYTIANVVVDGTSQGAISSFTFTDMQSNHTISASFQSCGSCQISCQSGCQISCQTGCEVSCETGCEVSCEVGCEVSCESCVTCQNCQTGCEVSCQSCNTCQTTCELSCQTGCEVSCQTGCEVSCETGCEVTCQTGCEVSCQTGCEFSCQSGCEVSCQTGCELCQVGCELCEGGCQPGCYACQDCQVCQSCQVGCEVSCESCVSCQNCQTGCEVSCQSTCETECQTTCEAMAQCDPCYDCQNCYNCQPFCYDYQICYLCQSSCYDCEACYVNY